MVGVVKAGGRARMRQQPAQIIFADSREHVGVIEGESVASGFGFDQRLVQMPAARHRIRKGRPAHEARQKSMAAGDLFNSGAEQHHRVGAVQAQLRAEGKFALARAELDFDRAQWQAELFDASAKNFHRRIEHVEARFGEILMALREQADLRRFRRPGCVGRRQPRVLQLEQMEFDFEPRTEIEARLGQRCQRVATACPALSTAPVCHW